MASNLSVGAIFSPYPYPPEALPDAAVAAERAGLDELWLWEDCFRHSAYAAASAALSATETLRVGIGIAPMPLRNVATTAMEIGTLERLFPGRLLPGVGHGVQDWMAKIGARVTSPLTLMREYVPALRALLAGETVALEGRYVTLNDVRLDWPPAAAPRVYAAAEGPKTLRLVGAVADGVVLDSRYTVEQIARSVQAVRAGRAEAADRADEADGSYAVDRDEPDVVAYVAAAFGPDGRERAIADWDGTPPADAAARVLAGSVEEVADGMRRFIDVGVRHVVLLPPRAEPDLAAYFDQVGDAARLLR